MLEEMVSLANLGGGAAIERFDHELSRILENISDPNTDPKAVREITLKVKIKPTQDRSAGPVEISCTSKLAPVATFPAMLYIQKDRSGRVRAFEHNPGQTSLFEDVDMETGEVRSNITSIEGRKAV